MDRISSALPDADPDVAVPCTAAATVAASLGRLLLEMAYDGDAQRIAAVSRAEGIDPANLSRPDGRLLLQDVERLVARVAADVPDPQLGFRAYERSHPGVFQTVGFAMMGCSSLLEAMRCLARHLPILSDRNCAHVVREAAGYRLCFERAPVVSPLLSEMALAALLGFCRFMTGGEPLRVIEIGFDYPAPADLSAYRALLGNARMHFGEPEVGMLMDAEQLERPLAGASAAVQRLQQELARLQLDAVRHRRLISIQVRQYIAENLEGRAPALETVAAALGRSSRSLQRELAMEGSTFSVLLDDTRRGLAQLYLQHSQVPLKVLAFQLGFGEASSFHRACMRWFGQTPLACRNGAAAAERSAARPRTS